MKHFLKFGLEEFKPKTNVYNVYKNDEYLGDIYWYNHWRQYVFESDYAIILSRECTRQLADFLDKITIEQKQKLHGSDNQ